MLSDGQTVVAIAEQQGMKREAIRERRRKWWKNGMNSSPDQPRCAEQVDGCPSQPAQSMD
ncbi:MAG: hypothetical protein LUQ11_11890 [Methylococcaceae bacterium]|nr:hypothetical protein [Methylococcaceae bacterium]